MKFLSAFNSDWLNPVLVKEVRQFFHNKFFFSLVGILLGVQLLLMFIFNLSFEEWKGGDSAGRIFITIDTVLMYLCVFLTAGWGAMQRFYVERASKDVALVVSKELPDEDLYERFTTLTIVSNTGNE